MSGKKWLITKNKLTNKTKPISPKQTNETAQQKQKQNQQKGNN